MGTGAEKVKLSMKMGPGLEGAKQHAKWEPWSASVPASAQVRWGPWASHSPLLAFRFPSVKKRGGNIFLHSMFRIRGGMEVKWRTVKKWRREKQISESVIRFLNRKGRERERQIKIQLVASPASQGGGKGVGGTCPGPHLREMSNSWEPVWRRAPPVRDESKRCSCSSIPILGNHRRAEPASLRLSGGWALGWSLSQRVEALLNIYILRLRSQVVGSRTGAVSSLTPHPFPTPHV